MPLRRPSRRYSRRFSDDLYDKTKGAGAFRKLAKMVGEQEYGAAAAELAATKKKLPLNEDPYFKKYSEVDSLIAQRAGPAVEKSGEHLQPTWAEVRKRHASEIEDDTVTKKVDGDLQRS